jgi:hypothetical protein
MAMIEKLIAVLLLTVFLVINIVLFFMRLFRKGASILFKNLLRSEIPENEKKGWEKIYTLVWLAVGLWAFWKLKDKTILGAFFGFFTFRSGANVGKLIVYSHHDAKLVEKGGEGRVLGMISTVVKLSLLLEGTFLAGIAISYKALSITLKGGETAGHFLLALWLVGLAFGIIFGLLISRNNNGILLGDSLSTLAFFTMRKVSIKSQSASEKAKKGIRGLIRK